MVFEAQNEIDHQEHLYVANISYKANKSDNFSNAICLTEAVDLFQ